MPDFSIDVGFNTKGFEDAVKGNGNGTPDAGVGGGADSGTGGMGGFGKGLLAALKASGIIALLMNLKVIVDLLGGILGLVSLGVTLFLKKIYEFFQDPTRGLLNFGIFLVNGFLTGLEFLIKKIPGVESDFELGRIRPDIVGQELDAGTDLLEALDKGFLTEKEYNFVKFQNAEEQREAQFKAFEAELDAGRAHQANMEFLEENAIASFEDSSKAFTAINKLWAAIINQANSLNDKISGTTTDRVSSSPIAGLSTFELLSKTSVIPKDETDARLINYLTGLGR